MQWAGWGAALLGIPARALPAVVDTAGDHFTATLPSIWGHAIPIRSCFYDPFAMQWAGWGAALLGIPARALPAVVDTAGDHFTATLPSIWGHAIPIRSCEGDVKLTMGTGTFLNINTGLSPHAGVSGLYPVVAWRVRDELVYSAEGANSDTASIITWAQRIGLFEKPEDTADIACSVQDTDGVYFIPAFSGLGPPYNDGAAASGFIGMKPSTTKAHLPPYNDGAAASGFIGMKPSTSKAHLPPYNDGAAASGFIGMKPSTTKAHLPPYNDGAAASGFIGMKPSTTKAHLLVSDLTGLRAERPAHVEMSSQGCALSVGLHIARVGPDGPARGAAGARRDVLAGMRSRRGTAHRYNYFNAQLVSDLTGLRAERPAHVEMSSQGCALAVGLHIDTVHVSCGHGTCLICNLFVLGMWKSKEELKTLRKVGAVFHPRAHMRKAYEHTISQWEDAVKRMCGWYNKPTCTRPLSTSIADASSAPDAPQYSYKVSNVKRNNNKAT
ncbi:putative glycerol kinase [Operophtera brumata]|uniref:Putative glycerol kinase n=1 Tax=Operophtera brumata TaxID=104452 RepID=A0A0L7KWY8_OPEBR|nr:putative glycerol kinase [Operophtera brumata]